MVKIIEMINKIINAMKEIFKTQFLNSKESSSWTMGIKKIETAE
jgi:hypothetical protein